MYKPGKPEINNDDIIADPVAKVVETVMSDGSRAYQVEMPLQHETFKSERTLVLAAMNHSHARMLAKELNDVAWVEVR